jgi:hypothetical protein
MDMMEKQELIETLREMKDLVDEALPLESSVVRDQVLMALMVNAIQAKLMARQFPVRKLDFAELAARLKDSFVATAAATLCTAAVRLVPEKEKEKYTTFNSAQDEVWETYQHFLRKLYGKGQIG